MWQLAVGVMARSAAGRCGEATGRGNSASPSRSSNDLGDDDIVDGPSTALGVTDGGSLGNKTDESTNQSSLGKRVTVQYPNGDVYEGELQNDKRHGRGVRRFANGGVYDGEWKDDEIHGRGTIVLASGAEYKGDWEEGKFHGKGKLSTDEVVYDGEWRDNLKHGNGKQRWKDGTKYDGQWVEGKKHGKGIYAWSNGNIYEGDFVDDEMHGWGAATYSATGSVFEGQWVEGKPHGKGTLNFASGDVYEGTWTDGQKESKGIMKWADGDIQTGCFDRPGGCKLRSLRSQQRRLETARKTCENCGNDDGRYKLRVCTGCGLALYCSIACQQAARGSHQRICNNVTELPPRDADTLFLRYDRGRMVDLDAGLRYATKYMDNMKHLAIDLRTMGKDDMVKLSAKQLSSFLRSKRGSLDSVHWSCESHGFFALRDICANNSLWKELHGLKYLRLQNMYFNEVQPVRDIIDQQRDTLTVLSLPFLVIGWSKAKCRRTIAQAVISCKNLVKLDLRGCSFMDSDLKIMLNGLSHLRVLQLSRHPTGGKLGLEFTDNTCGLIARKCPGLQELDLNYHNQLSVRGIRKIFEGCSQLRSFHTTSLKLSCQDVRNLLDIAPQLMYLYPGDKTHISEDELSKIIEATGGRTAFQLSRGGYFEPHGISEKTKERYESQIAVLSSIFSRRDDYEEVSNEWAGCLMNDQTGSTK